MAKIYTKEQLDSIMTEWIKPLKNLGMTHLFTTGMAHEAYTEVGLPWVWGISMISSDSRMLRSYLCVMSLGWWDFGTGAIGDMACHNLDPAFWALDLGSPISVEASCLGLNDENVPYGALYSYELPARGEMPPLTLKWYDGGLMPLCPRASSRVPSIR